MKHLNEKDTLMTNSFAPPTGGAVGAENFLTDGILAVLRVTRCHDCARHVVSPARPVFDVCVT